MRTFAILNDKNLYDFNENIMKWIHEDDKIYVFTSKDNAEDNRTRYPRAIVVEIPVEMSERETKCRNFISRYFKDNGTTGFLHVLSRTTLINKDPYPFIESIETMMKKIRNDIWFNCSCDPVNYVYGKFNPRFTIEIDDEEARKNYDKSIKLCSNANTQWIIYDLDSVSYERMAFDEDFTIAMFYIIEFLAKRRNEKKPGEFYYMNMYPTVNEELGVFISSLAKEDGDDSSDKEKSETIQKEDKLFHEKNIVYVPDHDIVQISEDLRNILVS